MDLGDVAKERAGEVGTEMAEKMVTKIRETIAGFPGSSEQKIAIADLLAEGCDELSREFTIKQLSEEVAGNSD